MRVCCWCNFNFGFFFVWEKMSIRSKKQYISRWWVILADKFIQCSIFFPPPLLCIDKKMCTHILKVISLEICHINRIYTLAERLRRLHNRFRLSSYPEESIRVRYLNCASRTRPSEKRKMSKNKSMIYEKSIKFLPLKSDKKQSCRYTSVLFDEEKKKKLKSEKRNSNFR